MTHKALQSMVSPHHTKRQVILGPAESASTAAAASLLSCTAWPCAGTAGTASVLVWPWAKPSPNGFVGSSDSGVWLRFPLSSGRTFDELALDDAVALDLPRPRACPRAVLHPGLDLTAGVSGINPIMVCQYPWKFRGVWSLLVASSSVINS